MSRNTAVRSWRGAAPLFAALGDETRLGVVARLSKEGPLAIARLTDGANVTRQAVTKHLQVLEIAGLVRGKREGRENVYELRQQRLSDAQRLLSCISRQWDETLDQLKAFVEGD